MGITDTIRKFYGAINDNDPDTAAAQVTDDAKFTELPTGRTFQGPAGVRENFAFWLGAFPDGKVEVINIIEAGDKAVVEFKGRGTNTGPMMTEQGEMPPTGKSVTLEFCDVLEIRGDKIAGGRTYYDSGSMMRQLGLMPETAGAATR